MNIVFIIQARLGSTRLPGKILRPFYSNLSIMDLLIKKLKQIPDTRIIMATTDSELDDPLAQKASDNNILCFRGSENDVLKRFIDAAETYAADKIIRVCSDNPFLDIESIYELIKFVEANSDYDYVSFNVNGTPSIKTHYGFWTEYVTLEALKKVQKLTDEKLYHEHVTNYIYTHPDTFKFYLLDTPEILLSHNKIRLTIDTQNDFVNAQTIYKEICNLESTPTIHDIIGYLDSHSDFYKAMESEINKNSK